MNMDGFLLNALTQELNQTLRGQRIDKIHQPHLSLVTLHIGKRKLVISVDSNQPYVVLSDQSFENPLTPPFFCLLLRKHLANGRIDSLSMDGFERVIRLTCLSRDELGNPTQVFLMIELTGRHSNLVLVNEKGVIIDAGKRVPFGLPSSRPVFPGISYEAPPAQEKISPLELNSQVLIEQATHSSKSVSAFLGETVQGMSQLLAREISHLFASEHSTAQTVSTLIWGSIAQFINELAAKCRSGSGVSQGYISRRGSTAYFHVIPLIHLGEASVTEGINQTVREVMIHSAISKDQDKVRSNLRKTVNGLLQKLERLTTGLLSDLEGTRNKDEAKRYGELLYAGIGQHRIVGETAMVTDYYDPNLTEVAVPVNSKLSLAENARLYFRRYNKAVGTASHATARLKAALEQKDYLQGLLFSIDTAQDSTTLHEIEQEMREEGLLRSKKNAAVAKTRISHDQDKSSGPLTFSSPDGFKVSVGRNNLQNNDLVKSARPGDIWLHLQKAPGSHCLIHSNGPVPDSTLLFAANLAAWFSSMRDSSSIPIDYTERRHVKRPSGAKPGFVIYDNQKTIVVKGAEKPL